MSHPPTAVTNGASKYGTALVLLLPCAVRLLFAHHAVDQRQNQQRLAMRARRITGG